MNKRKLRRLRATCKRRRGAFCTRVQAQSQPLDGLVDQLQGCALERDYDCLARSSRTSWMGVPLVLGAAVSFLFPPDISAMEGIGAEEKTLAILQGWVGEAHAVKKSRDE